MANPPKFCSVKVTAIKTDGTSGNDIGLNYYPGDHEGKMYCAGEQTFGEDFRGIKGVELEDDGPGLQGVATAIEFDDVIIRAYGPA